MRLSISIQDGATPAIRDAVNGLTFQRSAKVAAQGLRMRIRKHLAAAERKPNKNNWPKTHWFARARDRVAAISLPNGAAVSIDFPGFAMRYTGDPGTVRPVNVKNLAIPIHPMAYGKRPREFEDLVFVPVNRGRTVGLLSMRVEVGKSHTWINLFRLVKFVKTKADPSILPTDEEMSEAAFRTITALASRVLG